MKKKKNGGNGHGGGRKTNGKPPTMNERFDTIEKILKAHSSDIRNIKNGVAFLRARVTRIEDHLGIGPPSEI